MFEFIRGKITQLTPSKAIVDVHGIGYCIAISLKTFQELSVRADETLFFTSFIVKEDSHSLFGFLHEEDRELFKKLTSISGIGPKIAIGILGHIDPLNLKMAIEQNNTNLLSKIPGIGKKTAERMVLELKNKLPTLSKQPGSFPSEINDLCTDAVGALINLGYNPLDAQKAVTKVMAASTEEMTLPELLAKTLRSI